MWYKEVIKSFINKVKATEQNNAKEFLKFFFVKLKRTVFKTEANTHFQIEMMFGVISKLFARFNDAPEGSIDLNYFAKYLVGLVLVYAKHGNENYDFRNIDFIPLLIKSKYLGLDETINSYEQVLKTGKRTFTSSEQPLPFRAQAFVLAMNSLEKWILEELNYNLKIIPSQMTPAFKKMPPPLLYGFLAETVFLLGRSTEFDDFIASIYEEIHSDFWRKFELSENEQQFYIHLQSLIHLVHEFELENERLHTLIFRLKIASYAYLYNRNASSYANFAAACLSDIKKSAAEFQNFPKLKLTLERLYYSLKVLGLFHIQLETNNDAFFVEEIGIVLQLEGLKNNLKFTDDVSGQAAENVRAAIYDLVASYMLNKRTVDFKFFRKQFREIIEQVRPVIGHEFQGELFLARIEFMLLCLGLINNFVHKKEKFNSSRQYSERENNFFIQLEKWSDLSELFFEKASSDEQFVLFARIVEIIEAVIGTSALVYFQNRSAANCQVLKFVCGEVIAHCGLMLCQMTPQLRAVDSSLPYDELQKALSQLNLVIDQLDKSLTDYYRKGGRHTSFSMIESTNQESIPSHKRSFSI
ncbi:hypothetical protein [Legionella maceachernii]|uniref:DNA repair protein n=1 Tax=Legionella maceachernii TaxID=466 RepID=A0A0W0WE80_9GAMM|nr:hypothetical protein [Legionella maceachernii]KTD30651.1 DNA repair protein [Legionella maceachernii]SJZ81234.1 hypothetical protein SAMN02745128_01158 [Legionella maceachernii]SUP02801.1 Uncharacterised protein [Legionella maceachernii]